MKSLANKFRIASLLFLGIIVGVVVVVVTAGLRDSGLRADLLPTMEDMQPVITNTGNTVASVTFTQAVMQCKYVSMQQACTTKIARSGFTGEKLPADT